MLQIEKRRKRKSEAVFQHAESKLMEAWEAVPQHWRKLLRGEVTVILFDVKFPSLRDPEIVSRVAREIRVSRRPIGNLIPPESWEKTRACYLEEVRRIYLTLGSAIPHGDDYHFQMGFLGCLATVIWVDNAEHLFAVCEPAFIRHLNLNGWIPSREMLAAANPEAEPEKLDAFHLELRNDACRRLFNRVTSLFWFNPWYLEEKWYSIAPFMRELDQKLQAAGC